MYNLYDGCPFFKQGDLLPCYLFCEPTLYGNKANGDLFCWRLIHHSIMARGSLRSVEHSWFDDLRWNLESPSWMWNEKDALPLKKNFNISFVFAMQSWKLYITLYIIMYKNWKGRKFIITWWIKVAIIFHNSTWFSDLVKAHGLNNFFIYMNGIIKIKRTNIWTWTLKPKK